MSSAPTATVEDNAKNTTHRIAFRESRLKIIGKKVIII